MSVNDWIQDNISSELVKKVFATALETVFSVSDLSQFNLLYFLWILKTCGGYKPLMLTQGIA
jgi:hypothetical protein